MFTRALTLFAFLISLTISHGANAPVISVDGTVVTTSPVVRGDKATISMTTTFSNGSIFYTLDGSEPTGANTRYTGAFTITSTATLRAIAYSIDFSQSATSGPIQIQIVPTFQLNVTTAGGGSIAFNPIATGNRYPAGTSVTLTAAATPNSNFKFLYWTGAVSSASNPLTVQVDGDKNITAVFGGNIHILAATHGRIQMGPYGEIEDIPWGTEERITPIPDAGFYLATWGADATGAANPIVLNFTSGAPTYSALFLQLPAGKAAVSVYTDSKGGKVYVDRRLTVTNNAYAALRPSNLYDAGEQMLIVAEPNPGWTFVGWSGDASGKDNPKVITASGTKVIRGFFAQGAQLRIDAWGGGVTKSPPNDVVAPGTSVTLTPVPAEGFTFNSFLVGNQVITDNPATIVVNSNQTIYARFDQTPHLPKWSYTVSDFYNRSFAADDTGNSYFGEGAHLRALDQSGASRWTVDMPQDNYSYGAVYPADLVIDGQGIIRLIAGLGTRDAYHAYMTITPAGISGSRLLGYDMSLGRASLDVNDRLLFEYSVQGLGVYDPAIRCILADNSDGPGCYIPLNTGGSTRAITLNRPALDRLGNRYFTGRGYTNVLYRADSSGNIVWSREIEGVDSPLTIVGTNAVYVVGGLGRLWSFNFDGTLQWSIVLPEPAQPPVIGADGTLYLGATNSANFYALNRDGTTKWVRTPGTGNYTSAAVGADGTIYVCDRDALYAMDQNGYRIWQARGVVGAPPIIAGNTIFVPGSTISAFAANAAGPANSPWPMVDANAQQTATANAVISIDFDRTIDLQKVFMGSDGFHLPSNGGTVWGTQDFKNWTPIPTTTGQNGESIGIDNAGLGFRFYRLQR